MTEETLEGWEPEIGHGVTLDEVIERALDYRGNVTVVRMDGSELEGYLLNRNGGVPNPFVQLFDSAGDGPHQILYSAIRTIRFTGRDTAAGNSYAAWLRAKGAPTPASGM